MMSLKSTTIILLFLSFALLSTAGPGHSQRTMYLNLCQELVSTARSYESRANYHSRAAGNLMIKIESYAKLPKNQSTIQAVDNLFSQYDENRALERKYRELYRKVAAEADGCMKDAE